ncbi:methylenetetrahydrofolate reductase [Dehalococcoidia bacterium]|nr:methylenetetrahydrofolate reductase [Dehalococcoidia bacterium]
MAKVTEQLASMVDRVSIVCDVSPPRGGDASLLSDTATLDADFISIAYNPGLSVRVNSAMTAAWIKSQTAREVLFTIATRDMNKLALQSLLLGAQLHRLDNIVVVKGDPPSQRDRGRLISVDDYTPTSLISAVKELNNGIDLRGLDLRTPTNFCIGATIDLARDINSELTLTRQKVEAGTQFFLAQPTFDPRVLLKFIECYRIRFRETLTVPVFSGLQVMTPESIRFGDIPQWVTEGLDSGRTGEEIVLEVWQNYLNEGLCLAYLIPPILRGGRRDYASAQRVISLMR